MDIKNKIATAIVATGLIGAGIAGGFALDTPDTIVKDKIVYKNVTIQGETVIETIYEDKIVNVSVENPLNIEALEIAQELKAENKAMLSFIEDEVDEDVDIDYIMFEVDSMIEAENWIEDKFIDFLEDEEDLFEDGEDLEDYRKSEVSIKKIYDPEVLDRDFDDKNLELKYEVKVKAKESGEDSEYLYYNVIIPFEDGNIERDDIELE